MSRGRKTNRRINKQALGSAPRPSRESIPQFDYLRFIENLPTTGLEKALAKTSTFELKNLNPIISTEINFTNPEGKLLASHLLNLQRLEQAHPAPALLDLLETSARNRPFVLEAAYMDIANSRADNSTLFAWWQALIEADEQVLGKPVHNITEQWLADLLHGYQEMFMRFATPREKEMFAGFVAEFFTMQHLDPEYRTLQETIVKRFQPINNLTFADNYSTAYFKLANHADFIAFDRDNLTVFKRWLQGLSQGIDYAKWGGALRP